ncbi:MAG: hypothetical protein UU65_C0010G0004 [candidate division CPR2 bacterium GW2011_GWC1_41_48]|uniref:Uncharacterized protein n=1 Tax=candidate division CPR2 bacterium GW2011_GWC1_41_48 TaxID=1618344 RepID=A0A0G0W8Z6_UNCC2|nr:MAG: hypothetical protein UT47_C0009G0004 [candidate division CPR2 bacterium GW2011_GWC2_39_35]KKS08532.1 MAG: hypothetical protein UU65_C0010G0004 [candidate division CPR2 bacterium GW2011_GWC1_41_48]HCL99732.1 hypothetical protein [candidate division CPR2 bacterium]
MEDISKLALPLIAVENIESAIGQWLDMESYLTLDRDSQEFRKINELDNPGDRVKQYLSNLDTLNDPYFKERKASKPINNLLKALDEIGNVFEGDDLKTARLRLQRMIGTAYEHMATYDELSLLEKGHPKRNHCFLTAAYYYAKSDIELGFISDNALRMSESFGGAKCPDLQAAAFQKFFNDTNFNAILVARDSVEAIAAMSQMKRSQEVKWIEIAGSKRAAMFNVNKESMPNSLSN